MAIIKSIGVGKARKSIGNITYRTVRGRTIGSEKVTRSNAATRSASQLQSNTRILFTLINRYTTFHASDIKTSFEKSRYGSQRNNFYRINRHHLEKAFATLASNTAEANLLTQAQLDQAVKTYVQANPRTVIRYSRTGSPIIYLLSDWDSAELPVTVETTITTLKLDADDLFKTNQSPTFAANQTLYITGAGLSPSRIKLRLKKTNNAEADETLAEIITVTTSSPEYIAGTINPSVAGQTLLNISTGSKIVKQWTPPYVDTES